MKRISMFSLILVFLLLAADSNAQSRSEMNDLQNRWKAEIVRYTDRIKEEPTDIQAYVGRALNYRALRQYDKAISDYTKVIELAPRAVEAYSLRAETYRLYGRNSLAEIDEKKAANYKESTEAYDTGQKSSWSNDNQAALIYYNKAIELDPEYVQAYYARGQLHQKLKNYDLAINDFTKSIQLSLQQDPKYVGLRQLYYLRGNLYYGALKKLDLAIQDYTKVIELSPETSVAYYYRASIYREQNKLDLAISDYTSAIKFDPKSIDAYHWRGHSYSRQDKFDLAVDDFTSALKLNPDKTELVIDLLNDRASNYVYQGNSKFELAIADLNKAIEHDPNGGRAYETRAQIFCSKGEKARAADDEKKAIQLGRNITKKCL